MSNESKFETKAVHAGVEPDPSTGAIMTPIFATSTFVQSSPGKHRGYEYSRTCNPTRKALENSIAALENAKFGLATSSGCTAMDIILHLLNAKDHVICVDDVYGGTSRLLRTIWSRHGIEVSFADLINNGPELYAKNNTKLIWIETPTNPLLKIIDIKKVVNFAKNHNSKPIVVVDNTFATPYFQKPIELGANIVVHSTTKYLNGHSDVIGGCIVTNSAELNEKLHHIQNSMGGISGAFDSWLVLRGIKTLALRMKRHEENALEISRFLEEHKKVEKVIYPGLTSHPQHELCKKQMTGFGGMVTFFIKGGFNEALIFLKALKVFSLAESLGGVESLVDHPASMTHSSLPKDVRQALGINDVLIRLSVGIEHVDDLRNDLEQALNSY